jgi:hypothetical protein
MTAFGQSEIQSLIDQGLGYGADVLGEVCDWRRPRRAINPIDEAARMGTLKSWFDPSFQFTGKAPSMYGKPVFGALLNRAPCRVGDYLTAPSGTYFLAAIQPLLPTAAVACNAVATVLRAAGNVTAGAQPYGGRTNATDVVLMQGWPCSALTGGKQEAGRADLPGDVTMKGYTILMPIWPGVVIRTSDRISLDSGVMVTVAQAEGTDLGWRILGTQSEV